MSHVETPLCLLFSFLSKFALLSFPLVYHMWHFCYVDHTPAFPSPAFDDKHFSWVELPPCQVNVVSLSSFILFFSSGFFSSTFHLFWLLVMHSWNIIWIYCIFWHDYENEHNISYVLRNISERENDAVSQSSGSQSKIWPEKQLRRWEIAPFSCLHTSWSKNLLFPASQEVNMTSCSSSETSQQYPNMCLHA